jgi:cysteine desulfurase/selenocysteine lyase
MLDVRKDFPFLTRIVNGRPVIYFDNAATTQKPRQVMDCLLNRYALGMSNVHRAVNFLANEVTEEFENARETIARFIGAQSHEIVFVSNATQAINVVCHSLSLQKNGPLKVLTTTLEHHSNLLPWMKKGTVDFFPWTLTGEIHLEDFRRRLKTVPDLVTVARASNFLGVLHPVKEMAALCREAGVPILVDASQSIAHEAHDVSELQCDYLVMSGHKLYGPGGTGVLYMRVDVMEQMPPPFMGGSMIKEVHAQNFVLNDAPYRFEPGTPNIEGIIGLAKAMEYIGEVGYPVIRAHEDDLAQHAKTQLSRISGITMYGPPPGKACAPLVAFEMKRLAPAAVAKILGERANVIVRSGFHCAQPAHDQLGIGPTVRASFALYNTREEVDQMVEVLKSIRDYI